MKYDHLPKEGDLYKTYRVGEHTFHIRYGYYDESERGRVEPLPIFPNLKHFPLFTAAGERIVTLLQSPCRCYMPRNPGKREDWCGDCRYYSGGKEELGLCRLGNSSREGAAP